METAPVYTARMESVEYSELGFRVVWNSRALNADMQTVFVSHTQGCCSLHGFPLTAHHIAATVRVTFLSM